VAGGVMPGDLEVLILTNLWLDSGRMQDSQHLTKGLVFGYSSTM
jgi:hypothetical protein